MRERSHRPPPVLQASVPVRVAVMLVGFFVIAFGLVTMLRSDVGLSAWDVLHQGFADRTGLQFGTANIVVGVVVVVLLVLLGGRREIGLATLANMVLIGLFINAILAVDPLPDLGDRSWLVRVAAGAAGTVVTGVGFALYIAAGFGAGPRDALGLLVARRAHARIWVARTALELTVLGLGLVLGGTAGVGTVVFALGIGPVLEAALVLLERSGLARPGVVAPVPAT